jgi:hypothetical protein
MTSFFEYFKAKRMRDPLQVSAFQVDVNSFPVLVERYLVCGHTKLIVLKKVLCGAVPGSGTGIA